MTWLEGEMSSRAWVWRRTDKSTRKMETPVSWLSMTLMPYEIRYSCQVKLCAGLHIIYRIDRHPPRAMHYQE